MKASMGEALGISMSDKSDNDLPFDLKAIQALPDAEYDSVDEAPAPKDSKAKRKVEVKEPKPKKSRIDPEETEKVVSDPVFGNNEVVWDLQHLLKLRIHKFKSSTLVDIRKYYDTDKPSLKGISLKLDQFEELFNKRERIFKAISHATKNESEGVKSFTEIPDSIRCESCSRDADGFIQFELKSPYVKLKITQFKGKFYIDIRQYFKGSPTKKGIMLDVEVFRKILGWQEWSGLAQQIR
jgi:Transcriptional Coactivator p15 (PC4)